MKIFPGLLLVFFQFFIHLYLPVMPVWLSMTVAFFFMLTFIACKWELALYRNKKRELEALQQKLQEDGSGA